MTQGRGTQLLALLLSALLAVTLLPVAGIQSAYAGEPVERLATSGGDMALQSANGGASAAASAPAAEEREGGMLAAGGLLYTVADGGLSLVGFDGAAAEDGARASALEGALAVPAAVSVDGRDVAVVAVDLAEGNVAEGVTALSVPQSVKDIKVETLASAFPSLLSVEVTSGQASSLPVAAGAASMRATYSSFGGSLLGQATVEVEGEGGSVEAVQCRELVWAPPAMVVSRVPVDCLSIAPGALVDAKNLKTIVCFGDVKRIATAERDESGNVIAEGALTDDHLAFVTVVFPDATPAVPSDADERVSASMALNDGATQTDKRHAWIALGLPLERLSMGKPVGALTETVAVGDDGTIAKTDLQLVSYPGMHPRATDVKHPDESGSIDMADSGLAFTMRSDMTLSVHWEGDPTATPAHLEIPAYVAIDNVVYPVTEIADRAFDGCVFLESIDIPGTVTTVGENAFADCSSLAKTRYEGEETALNRSAASDSDDDDRDVSADAIASPADEGISAYDEGGGYGATIAIGRRSKHFTVNTQEFKSAGWSDLGNWTFCKNIGNNYFGVGGSTIKDDGSYVGTAVVIGPNDLANDHNSCGIYIYPDAGYRLVGITVSVATGLNSIGTPTLRSYTAISVNGGTIFIDPIVIPDPALKADKSAFDELNDFVKDGSDPLSVESRLVKLEESVKNGNTGGSDTDSSNSSYDDSLYKTVRVFMWGLSDGANTSNKEFEGDVVYSHVLRGENTPYWEMRVPTKIVEEKGWAVSVAWANNSYPVLVAGPPDSSSAFGVKEVVDLWLEPNGDSEWWNPEKKFKYCTNGDSSPTVQGFDSAVVMTDALLSAGPASYLFVPDVDSLGDAQATNVLKQLHSSLETFGLDRPKAESIFASKSALASVRADIEALKASGGLAGANTFFADAALDSSQKGQPWTSTIAVKLADGDATATKVTGVKFAANDQMGLLADQGKVTFAIGSTEDGVTGLHKFGDSIGDVALGEVPGGKGVWVKIIIDEGGINADRVMTWQTAKAYVASVAKLSYESLA